MTSWLERFGLHRPELRAWALYDWANSAMLTTVVTAVFPVFFSQVASVDVTSSDPASSAATASGRFALATTLSQVLIAVAAPVLGAMADQGAKKKRFLGSFMAVGVLACALMFFIQRGQWVFASTLFVLANVGASGSFVFYDALLPHIARDDELDRVSTTAYALGYLGGGIMLALNLAWILAPARFGLPSGDSLTPSEASLPARLSFLSVAVWWLVFSIPMFLRVPEPAAVPLTASDGARGALRNAFARLARTLHDLSRMRNAGLFLLAFLLYNDGIGTIIRMAVIYGAEIGIERSDLITAVLLVQFIGIPCALAFGWLAQKTSAKSAILLSLAVYIAISVLAWRMRTREHFYMLACGVALVQGGSQALSRSVFASMVPRSRSAEFFGLFAVLEKFAGVLGPAMFYAANQWLGSSRIGVGLVVVFFVSGAALLWKVDVTEGQRAAREVDAVPEEPVGES